MGIITYLTTIRLGEGSLREVGQDLSDLNVARPLIVTDRGIIAAGLLDRLRTASAGLASAPVFADVPTNPTEEATLAALALYRREGCDGVVAFGGGSPIDLGKGIALLATHSGPLEQYAVILGGLGRITPAVAPLIAIPTTAGTGSEVGRAALITLADGRKLGFISPHLIPRRAICDPELTWGLPPVLTAATGMDALTHCIETFLSPRDNPTADAIALDGLRRAADHIERATRDGSDGAARHEMMVAALHGGLTFQKGLGAVHALSHPLGGLKQVSLHHGMLNAVLLPHVLRFNADVSGPRYDALRHAMRLPDGADIADAVYEIVGRLGLPRSLAEMKVPAEALPAIAESAVLDHSSASNPRRADARDYESILRSAMN
jgi:hypothetical protein